MKSFFKYTFASIIGFLVASLVVILIFFGIVGSIVSSSQDKTTIVKDNSILKISLSDGVVDRVSENPMDNFDIKAMKSESKVGLNDILKELNKAAKDDKIKGIYLEINGFPAGMATTEEIRNALIEFKDSSDKFIIAYSDYYTQKSYYLASVADKIYVNPQGLVEWKGIGGEVMFYTEALKKIGVEPIIIRHGKFKSAVEPFMLSKMSDANREQTITYIGSIWNNIMDGISKKRGVSVEDLNMYADSMKIQDANDALNYKLVDGLKYKDEILAELKTLSDTKEDDDLEFITLGSYKKSPKLNVDKVRAKEKIAIIYGTGEINMGNGSIKEIGSDGLSEAIREARLDTTIKAVVLRVNSPGGSALASEVIWREVVLTKKVKPVVVSMGDVAASGGYYISCPADRIFASRNTITGSIGVFGLMFNGEELMDKIGISVDGVQTNAHSNIGSQFKKMTQEEKDVIQRSVEDIYGVFIGHVAEGRGTTPALIDSIGQGRVWSGVNAIEIGLIDEFGGLKDAVKYAAKKANLDNYRITELPKQKNFMEALLKDFTGDIETKVLENNLGLTYKYYYRLNKILQSNGVTQARIPYDIEIH